MFPGMSEKNFKDRLADDRARNDREIGDWMNGDGSKVLAVILIALVIWGVVSLFWK